MPLRARCVAVRGSKVALALVASLLAGSGDASAATAQKVRLYPFAEMRLPSDDGVYVTASTAVADVTGDGRADVLVTGSHYRRPEQNPPRLYVFRQKKNHTLAPPTWLRLGSPSGYFDLDTGDLDGDRDADVVVAVNGGLEIFRQGRRGLRRVATLSPFADTSQFPARAVAVADMNRDGRRDLVAQFGGRLVVLRQSPRGGFRVVGSLRNGTAREIEIGDVAGSALPDVVTFEHRRCDVQVYEQRRSSRFRHRSIGECADGIEVADVTGDGRADVIETYGGNTPTARVAVFKQRRRGFLRRTTKVYDIPAAVEAADVDRDGVDEIVVVHDGWDSVGVVQVDRSGAGTETFRVHSPTHNVPVTGLAVGDFDGDHRPDVALSAGYHSLVVHHSRTPRCLGRAATIVGGARGDSIRGTRRADVIWTGAGDDAVDGRQGDDRICTGSGNDAVAGRDGRDRLRTAGGADVVDGGDGADVTDGGPGPDVAYFSEISRNVRVDLGAGRARGQGLDRLRRVEGAVGSDLDDVLVGSPGRNVLVGLEGDDTLRGGDGDDLLQPHEGDDRVDGGPGSDTATFNHVFAVEDSTPVEVDLAAGVAEGHGSDVLQLVENVVGSATTDVLAGDGGANEIYALNGDDEVRGGGGDDMIGPGLGSDVVDGGAGSDWLDYSFGSYYGGFSVDVDLSSGTADYGPGYASVQSLAGIEHVRGSRGINELIGNDEPNQLLGLGDSDRIVGLGGDDLLDGGTGHLDRLDGGDGIDRCVDGEENLGCEDVPAARRAPAGSVAGGWGSWITRRGGLTERPFYTRFGSRTSSGQGENPDRR